MMMVLYKIFADISIKGVRPLLGLVVGIGLLGWGGSAEAALKIGSDLPAEASAVKMLNVDGEMISIDQVNDHQGVWVIFSCNHCPWAKAWEERIVRTGNYLLDRGVGVIMINPNDPADYPEDAYEVMQERAKATGMRFPYVVDETSNVARAFDAAKTPELFLFDQEGKLVYTGAFDGNADDPKRVIRRYFEEAADAMLNRKEIPVAETKSIGCSIKFRE
jgi:hypothetical protein